jgi:hypothetical protein
MPRSSGTIQRFNRALGETCDGDQGPAAPDPAAIRDLLEELQAFDAFWLIDGFVCHGIEHSDDVSVDRDRVRHGDIAHQHVSDGLRDHGLPISRRAIHEQGVPSCQRRAQLVEHPIAQDQM